MLEDRQDWGLGTGSKKQARVVSPPVLKNALKFAVAAFLISGAKSLQREEAQRQDQDSHLGKPRTLEKAFGAETNQPYQKVT